MEILVWEVNRECSGDHILQRGREGNGMEPREKLNLNSVQAKPHAIPGEAVKLTRHFRADAIPAGVRRRGCQPVMGCKHPQERDVTSEQERGP